ncbi:condensation domain-containing protein, partial [Nocardia rhamnosiphila]|uniref:condensation domain-containing protein n=1 Tax=Nocardia rhamnosiphila TaxID=426716 RepID=UPI0033F1CCA9
MLKSEAKILELHPGQYSIWLAQLLNPASVMYNTAQVIEIEGVVDTSILEESLRDLFADSEALRIRIVEVDGRPCQVIGAIPRKLFDILDLSGHTPAQVDERICEFINEPIDLVDGPLFYAALILTERLSKLLLISHHIVLDGYGLALVAGGVARRYSEIVVGKSKQPNRLASIERILREESEYENSNKQQRDRAYWASRIKDSNDADMSRYAPVRYLDAVSHSFRVCGTAARRMRDIAVECGASWVDVLMAALSVFFQRGNNSPTASMEFAAMCRTSSHRRVTPFMVMNIIPVSIDVNPGVTFAELVTLVNDDLLRGLSHQSLRREHFTDLNPGQSGRSLTGPLVNVLPFERYLKFGSSGATVRDVARGPISYLAIYAFEQGHELSIEFVSHPDLHSGESLSAYVDRFVGLLQAVVANPEQRVGDIDLLTAQERERLLVE